MYTRRCGGCIGPGTDDDEQIAGLYRSIAELMYRAVRLGGIPCTMLPWRWGYGWPLCR